MTEQRKDEKGERENKWISVRNKLPESYINVLFCDIDDDVMLGYHIPRAPETHFVEKGSWDTVKNVKAWMPLPDPYEG